MGTTVTSDFDGTPPLYITKAKKNNQDYIYVNNALILRSRSNIQIQNESGKKQVSPQVQMYFNMKPKKFECEAHGGAEK